MVMSQDCVVWNEDTATSATVAAAPASTNKTSHRTGNRHSSSHQEIESLFHLLGKGEDEEERVVPPKKNSNTAMGASTNSRSGNRMDDHDFPTPVHRNRQHTKVRLSSFQPSSTTLDNKKRPSTTSHVARKRTFTSNTTTSPVPISQNMETCTRRLGLSSSNILENTGFDDLLQQVETPSPHYATTATGSAGESAQQQALSSNHHRQTQEQQHQQQEQPASSKAIRMKPKSLSDCEFEVNATNKNIHNSNNTNKFHNNNQDKENVSLRQPPQNPYSRIRNSVSAVPFFDRTATPKDEPKVGHPQQSKITAIHTKTVEGNTLTTTTKQYDDEFDDFEISDEDFAQVDSLVAATQAQDFSQTIQHHHHHQQQQDEKHVSPKAPVLKSNSSTKVNTSMGNTTIPASSHHRKQEPEEDDPFGDFPNIDFDILDQALPGAVIPSTSSAAPISAVAEVSAQSSNNESKAALTAQQQWQSVPKKKKLPLSVLKENDDPFDDLGDIDLDALGAAIQPTKPVIATRQQSAANRSSLSATTTKDLDPFDDLGDIDFDALDAAVAASHGSGARPETSTAPSSIVCNSRSDSWQDETSYLAFTRYKILQVIKDEATYTQRLFVVPWDISMLDGRDRQALHKPSTLTGTTQASQHQQETSQKEAARNAGLLILRGSWFYLDVDQGDILHLCSLTGRFKTDASALPITLDTEPPPGSTYDDLVPIVHPEQLAIPTTITETLECSRRAVLKGRIGSQLSDSKALLLGTLRHTLFEVALKSENTSTEFLQYHIRKIVRAEAPKLVGCRMTSTEAERELTNFWPQVQAFKRQYINPAPETNHCFANLEDITAQVTKFALTEVKGVEEEVTSPELGLKGNLDVLVEAMQAPNHNFDQWIASGGPNSPKAKRLMSVELKTHHNARPQPRHFAQLTYYTVMLLARFGHTSSPTFRRNPEAFDAIGGSMLLYINAKSTKALHVAPSLSEIKSLIEQRNTYSSVMARASRPRGVSLVFQDDESAPKISVTQATPAVLPALIKESQCSRCFSARECMVYAASGSMTPDIKQTHAAILDRFTGHLEEEDLAYFRTWDRLIDLEADATSQQSVADAWLEKSEDRERDTGTCISSLVYHQQPSQLDTLPDDESVAFIVFQRSSNATLQTPFSSLNVQKGCYVTISTDATSLDAQDVCGRASILAEGTGPKPPPFRHQMKIFRGSVDHIDGTDKIVIKTSDTSVIRINDLLSRFQHSTFSATSGRQSQLTFRLDVDNSFSQMGTLRKNLVDLLTKDKDTDKSKEDPDLRMVWIQKRCSRLRELVIRLKAPVYDDKLKESMFNPPARVRSLPGCDLTDLVLEYAGMNDNQRMAAQKVASMRDYALIQGLPGTGKTSTIVFMARMLASQGKRVLITSYTHSAVDNCLLKLIESGVAATYDERPTSCVLRIGEKSTVHAGVQCVLASNVAANLEASRTKERLGDEIGPSAESYKKAVSAARIVGATALKIPKSPLLANEHFDVVIVDEAGQITQPALLGALAAADSFVLVGDHMQLPPLVVSESALEGGKFVLCMPCDWKSY